MFPILDPSSLWFTIIIAVAPQKKVAQASRLWRSSSFLGASTAA